MSYTVIGKRLRELCQEKNISNAELSKKCEMSETYLYRIMNCTSYKPSVTSLISICKVLGVTLDEFFNTEEFKELCK